MTRRPTRFHESCLVKTPEKQEPEISKRYSRDFFLCLIYMVGLLAKRGSATIFSVFGFFLHKTAANLPFTQRRRRIACVVDTDNETVATSAQQQWEHRHRRYYVNLEKDPSPESTMPVRAQCREYLNDFKGKLEITKMRCDNSCKKTGNKKSPQNNSPVSKYRS
jgi:hypothetical protein